MPRILGLEGQQVRQGSSGWVPVYADETQKLSCMSIGFLLKNQDDAVVWRGPKKNAMIKQFLEDVAWGGLDYLIIDTPPGTGDEHISLAEHLKAFEPDGAVIVTTPQAVALADVQKEVSFCKKVGFKILGVVENMSGYVCPHCAECHNLFSKGGGEALAKQHSIPFLGCVPIDPNLVTLIESRPDPTPTPTTTSENTDTTTTNDARLIPLARDTFVTKFAESGLFPVFSEITEKLMGICGDE
ncbi:Nucleotide-binding protein 2 [Blyttiomyces sp. JEL0837]|nr:Nucleotide-binding protein 2 [Blyttiomyces sp. JEL0837]